MSNHTGGPTLNTTYNKLLQDWAAQGCASDPQCEECGKDTTDKQMHDIGTLWVCRECNIMLTEQAPDEKCYEYSHCHCHDHDREDFHSDG